MKKEEIDYCEAGYVDFQHEYSQKLKPEGITLGEMQHSLGATMDINMTTTIT